MCCRELTCFQKTYYENEKNSIDEKLSKLKNKLNV